MDSYQREYERAQMERDTKNKQELEYYTKLNASIKEAKEEGIALGKEEGIAIGEEKGRKEGEEKGKSLGEENNRANMVKTMYENGMSKEDISKYCKLELSYVEEVLKK